MNALIVALGLTTVASSLIHLVPGGREVLVPMRAAPFDAVARETLHVCWHIVSLHLALGGALMVWAGLAPSAAGVVVVRLLSTFYLGYAALFLAIAARSGLDGRFVKLGQWIVFLPLGVLGWAATLGHP